MAAIINPRDTTLQAATPRLTLVSLPSVNLTNSSQINGTDASTVVTNANAGASHATLTGNPHNVSLVQISGDLDDINDGVTYFKTTSNQRTGAGRAFSALDSTNEYIQTIKSTKLAVVGSNPSTGWVGDANGIRMYQGGTLKVNIPVSGNPSFSGDITGGANIDITGKGVFNGGTLLFGYEAAVHANGSRNALRGVVGFAGPGGGAGVLGDGSTGGYGVIGTTNDPSRAGIFAENDAGGTALEVGGKTELNGTITTTYTGLVANLYADNAKQLKGQIGNFLTFQRGTLTGSATATFTSTNKPGSNSANSWMQIKIDSTTLYIPVWT